MNRGLIATVRKALAGGGGGTPHVHWVPGRIEVFGKHTDYAGGRSLLCAVERGFAIAAAPRADAHVTIRDVRRKESVEFDLDAALVPTTGHWPNYPMTVARRIARNFGTPLRGADIAFGSDLPSASGLSSSSAFVTAIFLALSDVNDLPSREPYRREIHSTEDLAGYLGCVENGYAFGGLTGDAGVGTFGGSEDHTAILRAQPDALVQYSFSPVRLEGEIPLPEGYVFLVAFSGVVAEKTGAALERYNSLSRLAGTVLERWRGAAGRTDATLAAALAAVDDAPAQIRPLLEEIVLRDRFEQFLEESTEVIPAAARAMTEGDLERFGKLADYSMDLATRLLGNQVKETVFLAREARLLGATAASGFGAGFGGSVWALTPASHAEELRRRLSDAYRHAFPEPAARATFFITRAAPAAQKIEET